MALYVRIAEKMRRNIANGTWAVGTRLQTVDELAAAMGVARITMRQALHILRDEKLIDSMPGRGTHVVSAPGIIRWHNLRGDWDAFFNTNSGRSRVLSEDDPAPLPHSLAELAATDRLFTRMKLIGERGNQVPVSVRTTYVRTDLHVMVAARVENEPILAILADHAVSVRILNEIEAADEEIAALLKVPSGTPLLSGRHIGMDAAGAVAFVDLPLLRGDVVKFEIDLRRDS